MIETLVDSLREDIIDIVRKTKKLPEADFFRCHEVARIYTHELTKRGYKVEQHDGLVRYRRGFLATKIYGEPKETEKRIEEAKHTKINTKINTKIKELLKSLNHMNWTSIAGENPDEFTAPIEHSWCEIGKHIIDAHPGGISFPPDMVMGGYFIWVFSKKDLKGNVIYEPRELQLLEIHPAVQKYTNS